MPKNAMSMRVRNMLPLLLPLACFLAGGGVHAVYGAGCPIPGQGESFSRVVSNLRCLSSAAWKEGIGGCARRPASRSSFPKRRRLRDDDSNDGAPCATNCFDKAKWKAGIEGGADSIDARTAEKEDRRGIRLLFPGRGRGVALSALSSSLLLSRPPPAVSG